METIKESTTSMITKTPMETTDKPTPSLLNQPTVEDNLSTNTPYEIPTLIGSTRKQTTMLTTQSMVETPNLQNYKLLNQTTNRLLTSSATQTTDKNTNNYNSNNQS